jgi:hypothetical protein
MPNPPKAKRGGKRAGAGRRKDVSRDLVTGAKTALRMLNDLDHEKELKKLYATCFDSRLQAHIIFRLREWAFGKPVQPQEDKIGFDPDQPLRVLIEHIGGSTQPGSAHPAAAKAK